MYKVWIGTGVNKSLLYSRKCIVDTGVRPNLNCKVYLRRHWKRLIKCLDAPELLTATNESIKVQGIIMLIVKTGNLQVRCDLLWSKTQQTKYYSAPDTSTTASKELFAMDRNIVLIHYPQIPVLGTDKDLSKILSILSH